MDANGDQTKEEVEKIDENTVSHLEKLSLDFVAALNDRTWEKHRTIIERAAPKFRGSLDTGEMTAPELLEGLKQIAVAFPEMALTVTSCNGYVYPNLAKADVYMTLRTTGHPPGVVREGLCNLEWELISGKWLCVRHTGFPGWGSLGAGGEFASLGVR